MALSIGSQVRVVTAPDKLGEIVADAGLRAGKQRWLVEFKDKSRQQLPDRNLELVEPESAELSNPRRYGSARSLRKLMTHARISGRLNDVLYSMETTNTEFLAYQFKPVLNFLSSSSSGLLIADEVGLGKTIEAGLVWTEIKARYDLSRLLVVCPPHLQTKWQSELNHRFGINADIKNSSELLETLISVQSRKAHEFAVIASLDSINPPKKWKRGVKDDVEESPAAKLASFLETSALDAELIDCTIIDEAHYLRNTGTTYNTLGHLLRNASEYLLLLSATPIQIRDRDLFNILNILDPINFDNPRVFEEVLQANAPIVKLSADLRKQVLSIDEFKTRIQTCLNHKYTRDSRVLKRLKDIDSSEIRLDDPQTRVRLANQIERTNLLGSVISRSRKKDVLKSRIKRQVETILVTPSPLETSLYERVTKAVRSYCQGASIFEGFQLTTPQKQLCSSMPGAYLHWASNSQATEIDAPTKADKDLQYLADLFQMTDGVLDTSVSIPTSQRSQSQLSQYLRDEVLKDLDLNTLKASDSKFLTLNKLINKYWDKYPNTKIVLFAYYRSTLEYLRDRLASEGIRSVLLMGGMEKEQLVAQFKKSDGPNLLLSTEVLSEGVDLQFSSALVNYDLPWNPMKVEQRIGRIDRIGQKQNQITIWNFIYKNTIDERIYNKLFERLGIFERSLGDIEQVLGEQISALTNELLTKELSEVDEISAIEHVTESLGAKIADVETSEKETDGLVIYGDFIEQKANNARRLKRYIDGSILWTYVRDFLTEHYHGSTFVELNNNPLTIEISLSTTAREDLRAAIENDYKMRPTKLSSSDQTRSCICIFDNRTDFSKPNVEIINATHSIVKFVSKNIRKDNFYNLVAAEVSGQHSEIADGQYYFSTELWKANGAKSYDRLVTVACNLDTLKLIDEEQAELLINAAINDGEDWRRVGTDTQGKNIQRATDLTNGKLRSEFAEFTHSITEENADQLQFLRRGLEQKFEREMDSLQSVYDTYKSAGNDRMLRLSEGRIRKIKQRLETRYSELSAKERLDTSYELLASGVIRVF